MIWVSACSTCEVLNGQNSKISEYLRYWYLNGQNSKNYWIPLTCEGFYWLHCPFFRLCWSISCILKGWQMNFQEGISMQFSFSLKNFLHFIWCKQLSIFKPCYRLKTYIISCRLKFLGCLHVWAILMIPQVILLDENVNVTSLFDLHSNRQESGINERLLHLYTCPIWFFYFQINYSNPIWAWVPLQTEGVF